MVWNNEFWEANDLPLKCLLIKEYGKSSQPNKMSEKEAQQRFSFSIPANNISTNAKDFLWEVSRTELDVVTFVNPKFEFRVSQIHPIQRDMILEKWPFEPASHSKLHVFTTWNCRVITTISGIRKTLLEIDHSVKISQNGDASCKHNHYSPNHKTLQSFSNNRL